MERIAKDPRVVIHKVFKNNQQSMGLGWGLSMCYSFDIDTTTLEQMLIIHDDNISMEDVFDMMKNTHEAIRDELFLPDFYKEIMQTILQKFIVGRLQCKK